MPPGAISGVASGERHGHGGVDEVHGAPPQLGLVPPTDPVREDLHRFAEVAAREFNDEAPFRATLSRLVNLYRRADLSTAEFAERFDSARQQTKERTAAIHRHAQEGANSPRARKNKMPYFFALLEDLLGLREGHSLAARGAGHRAPPQGIPAPAEDGRARYPRARAGSERNRPVDGPPAPSGRPTDTSPPVADAEDAQLIREVVREFSRQFAEAEVAAALGDWAVTLWRESGLSRRRFLDAAQIASEGMGRDRTVAASVPLFRSRLATVLRATATDERVDAARGGQLSLQLEKIADVATAEARGQGRRPA